MKTKSLFMTVVVYLALTPCLAQQKFADTAKVDDSDAVVYNRLMGLDFSKYVDKKTVGQFLADVGIPYQHFTWGTVRSTYLHFVYFAWSEKLWVELQVNEFRHMHMYSPEHDWDIEKFKKEKIGAIRFKYRGACVKCLGLVR